MGEVIKFPSPEEREEAERLATEKFLRNQHATWVKDADRFIAHTEYVLGKLIETRRLMEMGGVEPPELREDIAAILAAIKDRRLT